VAVTRSVALPEDVGAQISTMLAELFSITDQFYGESGLYNALYQSTIAVDSVDVDASGHATVNLTGDILLGGTCDSPRFKTQIERTAGQFPAITGVTVNINGEPIDVVLSDQG
jgi:hypothetical protein